MSFIILKQGDRTTPYVTELSVDTRTELMDLPRYPDIAYGSFVLVIEDSSVHMLNSNNEWKEI